MMILGTLRLYAPVALMAGLAAPLSAAGAGPSGPAGAEAKPLTPADGQGALASHSRKVELPFLLEPGLPEQETRATVHRDRAGPHPFRESSLQKASFAAALSGADELRDRRLSRYPEFG
jgi:hypothetical protein